MNKKLKIFATVLVIVILMGLGFLALKDYMITSSPINNLEYSIFKTAKEANYDLSVEVNFEASKNGISEHGLDADKANQVVGMLDKVYLGYDFKIITDDPNEWIKAQSSYNLGYDKYPLLDLRMIMNSEVLGIGMNNFYDKYFIFKYEDFLKKALEKESVDIDFGKYFEIIRDKKSDEYKTFLKNAYKYKTTIDKYLENNLTEEGKSEMIIGGKVIKVTDYKVKINLKEYFETLDELLNELRYDEYLEAYCEAKLVEILNAVIESGDYKLLDLSRNDIEEAIEKIEDNFSDFYDDSFDRCLSVLDEIKLSHAEIDGGNYTVSIDKKHKIRQVRAEMDVGYVAFEVICTLNNFGEDVMIKDEEDKYIDVSKYYDSESSKDELSLLLKGISLGVISEVTEGEGYKTLSEDLGFFKDYAGFGMNEVLKQLIKMKDSIKNFDFKDLIGGYLGNLQVCIMK